MNIEEASLDAHLEGRCIRPTLGAFREPWTCLAFQPEWAEPPCGLSSGLRDSCDCRSCWAGCPGPLHPLRRGALWSPVDTDLHEIQEWGVDAPLGELWLMGDEINYSCPQMHDLKVQPLCRLWYWAPNLSPSCTSSIMHSFSCLPSFSETPVPKTVWAHTLLSRALFSREPQLGQKGNSCLSRSGSFYKLYMGHLDPKSKNGLWYKCKESLKEKPYYLLQTWYVTTLCWSFTPVTSLNAHNTPRSYTILPQRELGLGGLS